MRPTVEDLRHLLGARFLAQYRSRAATPETWRRRSGVRLSRSVEVAALRAILRQAAREAVAEARKPKLPSWPWWF